MESRRPHSDEWDEASDKENAEDLRTELSL